MRPIALWYHCLIYMGDPPELRLNAFDIVCEQMAQVSSSGLLSACTELIVGCNGGQESIDVARFAVPFKAKFIFHGLQSRAENLTIVALHEWAKKNPGWNVLYFHAKGCSHPADDSYGLNVSRPWRRAMMDDLVGNWHECVSGLHAGADIVCSHFMWNMADGTQHIPAGNFLWTTSDFVSRLPSMYDRDRIKVYGIAALESRYEAEVFWGNGPRPNVLQMRPNGGGGVP